MDGQLDPMRGALFALLDSQYSVEVKMEHQIQGNMGDYPVLINPEWTDFKPGFKEELLDYVKNGGHLIVIGPKAAGAWLLVLLPPSLIEYPYIASYFIQFIQTTVMYSP
jgi:hypothetical protein